MLIHHTHTCSINHLGRHTLLLQLPLRRKAVFVVSPEVVAKAAARAAKAQAAEAQAAEQQAAEPPGVSVPSPTTEAEAAEAAEAEMGIGEMPVSPFAALARCSAGAASLARTSQSSGAGSAADATLLRSRHHASPSHNVEVVHAGGDGAAAGGAVAALAKPRLHRLMQRWFVRWFLRPVFGYDPDKFQGEWCPPDGYDARCRDDSGVWVGGSGGQVGTLCSSMEACASATAW